ncbi:sulfotransferase [Thiomicrorhabdus sp. Milos-T2]|uniref:sulfotransferase family protein n=1 Tax=Thiomicrorhabdus sp. Milos-T2 TaxID=90814 RepID=UPI000494AB7F|nr:sulfotransferase [Thiomicrorhabdus sp. Milos-T2]
MKSPIFLFSLPRSGSTLLQRVLMSHSQIASVAEPWIMLPFSYAYKPNGVLTEYSHNVSFSAIEDFIDNLPNKETDYYEALGDFASTLYQKQCKNNEIYFLDKTPRYYLIIPEIFKAFPDAKFIFLFRNPIHVMSSMMQTWSNGTFRKMYHFERDLNLGPKALSDGFQLLGDKALAIQYEQFVSDPAMHVEKICQYLDIEFDVQMLESFANQDTKGRMGDPKGVHDYKSVSTGSIDKWKLTFATKYRKKLALNYFKNIEDSVLLAQGYNKKELIDEIEDIPAKQSKFLSDRIDVLYSVFVRYFNLNIFLGKATKKWVRSRYLS